SESMLQLRPAGAHCITPSHGSVTDTSHWAGIVVPSQKPLVVALQSSVVSTRQPNASRPQVTSSGPLHVVPALVHALGSVSQSGPLVHTTGSTDASQVPMFIVQSTVVPT